MSSVSINGKEYPLRVSLNAIEAIQDRYGNMTAMGEHLGKPSELKFILATLVNEGMKYAASENMTTVKLLSEDYLGVVLDYKALSDGNFAQAIVDAFNESTGAEKN